MITLASAEEALDLFGQYDENLSLIEKEFLVTILARGNQLTIKGNQKQLKKADVLLRELLSQLRDGHALGRSEVMSLIQDMRDNGANNADMKNTVCVTFKGKRISAKGPTQKKYIEAIDKYDLVFSIGPAGTGKTYLACAAAVAALTKGEVSRIILTRPVVEAGEKLGFLPGDLQDKVDPYLRPLYDALYEMLGYEKFKRLKRERCLEIVPLAYMRGRTLNDAFIILDEAQNTSREQMKMFLTRLGFDIKAVVTGDITQIDLENKSTSGLVQVQSILRSISGIKFVYSTQKDVVRHPLVKSIISAYQKHEENT
ncbi:MAG: PhoH family protein [bacterium]